jgi:hypothetical protein
LFLFFRQFGKCLLFYLFLKLVQINFKFSENVYFVYASIKYIYNHSTLSGFFSGMVLILFKGLCKKINTDRPPFSISYQVCLSTSCLQSKSNEKKGEGDRMIFQELEILHFKTCHIEKYDLEILEPPLSNTGVSDCCLTPTFFQFFNYSIL